MKSNIGIAPQIRDMVKQRDKALSGDIVFSLTLEGDAPSAGTGFDAISVRVAVEDSAGNVHDWFNKTITTNALSVTTAGNGTATQAPANTCVIKNGVGRVSVTGANTWAEGDTFTVSVPNTTILGYTVASKSITATCTA